MGAFHRAPAPARPFLDEDVDGLLVAEAGARFEVVAESHQPEVLREMVLLGVGWTVLPVAGMTGLDELDMIDPALTERQLVLLQRGRATPNAAAAELAGSLTATAQ